MIVEGVVALCMFINNELKEHRIQTEGMRQCLKGKREAERTPRFRQLVIKNKKRYNRKKLKRLD